VKAFWYSVIAAAVAAAAQGAGSQIGASGHITGQTAIAGGIAALTTVLALLKDSPINKQ
jgi:hypothetical protein